MKNSNEIGTQYKKKTKQNKTFFWKLLDSKRNLRYIKLPEKINKIKHFPTLAPYAESNEIKAFC